MRLAPDEIYRKPYQPEPTRHYPEIERIAGKPRMPVGKPLKPVGTPPRTVGNHPRPTRKPPKPAGKPPRPPPYQLYQLSQLSQRSPVTTLPDIHHQNTRTLGTPEPPRTHKTLGTPEPLPKTDEYSEDNATPEPLFRVTSYPNLESGTIPGNLEDNRENYAIYDKSLRLSPVCGEGLMDHDYVVTYHRYDSELAKICEICHANPYKLRETSARCIDCDMYLCIRCYTKLNNASDVNQKYRV